MASFHDRLTMGTSQNLAYSTSAGTAVSTTGLSAQTKFVRLCALGIPTATGGVRYAVGTAPVATPSSTFLPLGWVEEIRVGMGEKISALGNDTTTGTLSITESLT